MSELLSLINHKLVHMNSHKSFLIESALLNKEGTLGTHGELVILTGTHTGRSANDKYVVVTEKTEKKIWWDNNIHKMSEEVFELLKKDVIEYLKEQKELYFSERSIGSTDFYSLGIEFISNLASAALFSQYMFKDYLGTSHHDYFKILHAPDFILDPKKYGTRTETVIVTCFKTKMTIIVGTKYAGEIKKSMFSTMNFILPDYGILPMHSGANQNSRNESFVFFGLSGTGKTTLSTDEGLQLIGDDEHGLSSNGIFNFEGGCYAKTSKLSFDTEPAIYKASTQFASFLENVYLSEDRSKIDFFDDSLSENGRASYPLSFIDDRVESGVGKIPQNIFYLSADAFGVLPPVCLLNDKQASDYFKLGYSAKLAGTEIGIKSPVATFSSCFGAPFMLCYPEVYSQLLNNFISQFGIKVWLINTGWYGGSYGKGERFSLSMTRSIIREIQQNNLKGCEFTIDEVFNLNIPKSVKGIDSKLLIPQNAWKNKEEYFKIARGLAASFEVQLSKLK